MKFLGAGLDEHGGKKALVGGTLSANPLSCCAGYYAISEIESTRAWEKAALLGDRLTDGLNALIDKKGLPFVAYNVGSICHLDTVGTMHFAIRWSKPWEIPTILKETSKRKAEMQHMVPPIWQRVWSHWQGIGCTQVLPILKRTLIKQLWHLKEFLKRLRYLNNGSKYCEKTCC